MGPPMTTDPVGQASARDHSSDESSLVARLQARQNDAFAELVKAHSARMLAVARRICPQEAEDVLQEAFLSAFKAIDRFDGRSLLGTWLHRITVNAALMRRRRRSARPEVAIDNLLPRFKNGFFESNPPEIAEPVTRHQGLDIQQKDSLWAAIDSLPEDFRAVVVLRDLEGLESSAVALVLGISDALVRQRLHRARLALVKLLEPGDFIGVNRS